MYCQYQHPNAFIPCYFPKLFAVELKPATISQVLLKETCTRCNISKWLEYGFVQPPRRQNTVSQPNSPTSFGSGVFRSGLNSTNPPESCCFVFIRLSFCCLPE